MTLQQYWDDCVPGDPSSPNRWERPILKGKARVIVDQRGFTAGRVREFSSEDGKAFWLDCDLRDGRTLRLIMSPDQECERVDHSEPLPLDTVEYFGFPKRDPNRPVTDDDRLYLSCLGKSKL